MWIMDSGGGVRVGEKAISVLTGNNPYYSTCFASILCEI